VKVTDNIRGLLWSKMGYANMAFATATVDVDAVEAIDHGRPLMAALMAEVSEVSEREGVRLEPYDHIDPAASCRRSRPTPRRPRRSRRWSIRPCPGRGGAWGCGATRPCATGRPRSIDGQIGLGVAISARHGLAIALTHRLVAIIHAIERGERPMAWANVEALERRRRSAA
jgi:2-dehydropantoate 2-reductase